MADNCHNGKDKAYDPEAPSSGLNSNQQREDDQDSEFDDVADEDAEIDETSGSQVQSGKSSLCRTQYRTHSTRCSKTKDRSHRNRDISPDNWFDHTRYTKYTIK